MPPKVKREQLKTIDQCWKEFEARVLVHGVPTRALVAGRVAFFAGAAAVLGQVMAVNADSERPLDSLRCEIEAFIRSLGVNDADVH